LTDEECQQALEAHEWVYAKTMPRNPHEYTLRKAWQDDAMFDAVVMHIRELGYQVVFGRKPYTQLDAGDFFYWTMGSPLDETILINRKRLGGYSADQVEEMKQRRRSR